MVSDLVSILSWNVMNATRASKDERELSVIERVLTRHHYDLIVLQEIEGTGFLDNLQRFIRDTDLRMRYEHSGVEPWGEFYVFLYDTNTVQVMSNVMYPDEKEEFRRPPYLAYVVMENGWQGVLVNVHTSPKIIKKRGVVFKDFAMDETRALEGVVKFAKARFETDNVLLIGDMNCWPPYFSSRKMNPFAMSRPADMIGSSTDTTISREKGERVGSLDHIILDRDHAEVYGCRVLRFNVEWWRKPFQLISNRYDDRVGIYRHEIVRRLLKPAKDVWYAAMKGVSDHWPVELVLYADHRSEFGLMSPVVGGLRHLKGAIRGVRYHDVQ